MGSVFTALFSLYTRRTAQPLTDTSPRPLTPHRLQPQGFRFKLPRCFLCRICCLRLVGHAQLSLQVCCTPLHISVSLNRVPFSFVATVK